MFKSMIIELRALESTADARDLVREQIAIYVRRAGRREL